MSEIDKDLEEVTKKWEEANSAVVAMQNEPGFIAIIQYCNDMVDHHMLSLTTDTDHSKLLSAQAYCNAYQSIIQVFTITD